MLVLPSRKWQICKGYTCVLRGRRLAAQLLYAGRSRPGQTGCSAGARPVELHCAKRCRSCHGNLLRNAPKLIWRCVKIQRRTPTRKPRARCLLGSQAKPQGLQGLPKTLAWALGGLFHGGLYHCCQSACRGAVCKKAWFWLSHSGMSSFYKSTAGIRNALRENLGFRGAKATAHIPAPALLPVCCIVYTFCRASDKSLTCACDAQNLAAWGVAGTIAYYLWVKPEQKAEAERRVRSKAFALVARVPALVLCCSVLYVGPTCLVPHQFCASCWQQASR